MDWPTRSTRSTAPPPSWQKTSIGDKGYVAASVGPTGHIVIEEGGDTTAEQLYEAFKAQVIALAEGGADAICVETMSSVVEAEQAIKATKENTNLPVICTFAFEPGIKGFRTMMGVKPERAAKAAAAAGADVVGANCGMGISNMIEITRQMRAAVPERPNSHSCQCRPAGRGKRQDGIQGDSRAAWLRLCLSWCKPAPTSSAAAAGLLRPTLPPWPRPHGPSRFTRRTEALSLRSPDFVSGC